MVRTSKKKEHSLASVLFSALAAAILGILLGFSFEVQRSPEFVRSQRGLGEGSDPATPVFRLGGTTSTSGWQRLAKAAQSPTGAGGVEIGLREGDLNSLANEYLNFTQGKHQALQGKEEPTYAILPETPNFAIAEERLQIAVPFEIFFFGIKREAYLVAVGEIRNNKSGPSFSTESAWINSARIPSPLADILVTRLVDSTAAISQDSPLIVTLSQIGSAKISNDELVLSVR